MLTDYFTRNDRIEEIVRLNKFINDRRHRGSDRYQATVRRDEISEEYHITTGEVIEYKEMKAAGSN